MKLTLGFSPCPNDTFIFEAMANHRIDTEGLEFDYLTADAEELNKMAKEGKLDITKISCAAYPYVANNYLILDSGSALGSKNGPLLISKHGIDKDRLPELKIAIPGKYTTANLLFTMAFPNARNKVEYLFSDIEDAVLSEEVDIGLLIHESRFTYQQKGLLLMEDMGEFWEDKTGLPLPLGVIGVNRRLPNDVALKVNRIVNRSLERAYTDVTPTYFFVRKYARALEAEAISSHIKLFVNDFSLDLGAEGKAAIRKLLSLGYECGFLPPLPDRVFLT